MRTLFGIILVAAFSVISAHATPVVTSNFNVGYTVTMTPGTKDGNNMIDIAILEAGAGQTSLTFPYSVNATGQTTLSHTISFLPTAALIVGLDGPLDADCGIDPLCGTHVIMFVNNGFAATAANNHFSVDFPNSHESTFITTLLAAEAGNTAAQNTLKAFFQTGDGAAAAFTPGGAFTALEFTIGNPIGNGTSAVPEPATVGLFAIGLGAMAAIRRRRMARQ